MEIVERLYRQKDRDDPVGHLAQDAHGDEGFPRDPTSFDEIEEYLHSMRACEGAIKALRKFRTECESSMGASSAVISVSVRYEVLKRDGFKCQVCGATARDDGVKLEVDHQVPKSRGGSNDPENLWCLCRACNQGKRCDVLTPADMLQ